MRPAAAPAVFALALPLHALAACPWLDREVASQVLLAKAAEARMLADPGLPNSQGVVSTTACRFQATDDASAQLTVTVFDLGNDANAMARYEGEQKGRGSGVQAATIDGNPVFSALNPGSSAASIARKGKYVVVVNHVFGKRARDAGDRDPSAAVSSTRDVARRVLEKL